MARTTWGPLSTDEQNQIEFAPVGEPGVLVAGTAGALLKRNADGTIGNSILSESGSVLTAAGRLVIGGGTVTASAPVLDLSQTWNYGAVVFTGIKLNVTATAQAAGSRFIDFQSSSVSVFNVSSGGTVTANGNAIFSGSLYLGSAATSILVGSAANTIDLRNSTNAQTFQVFGTYTDASNYRRLRSTMTTGGAATIAAEGLGTGVSGNTLVFTVNGSTAISIPASLNTTFGANIYAPAANVFGWVGRNALSAPADAAYLFQNSAGTDADIFLKFGVNTSAAAGIKRVGTVLQVRLNDDSARGGLEASVLGLTSTFTMSDAANMAFGTTIGTKIGGSTSQKIGFWNATPIVQPSSTGETVGFTAGGGTTVTDASTFTGNVGATAYRLSDIVKHLKNAGLLAQ